MTITRSQEVFFDQMKDLNSVEDQITDTLPYLAGWATDSALKKLLGDHLLESRRHRHDVKAIFARHGTDPGTDVCKAIQGLIEGGNRHIERAADPVIRDLLLIAHNNRIVHYEIAAYGFTAAIAATAGFRTESVTLAAILEEERAFAAKLAKIGADEFGVPVGILP